MKIAAMSDFHLEFDAEFADRYSSTASCMVKFLQQEFSCPFNGPRLVVTHHAPSPGSIAPQFRDNSLNPALASDLNAMIRTYQPPLWIHGPHA
jgi:hypothetical protein